MEKFISVTGADIARSLIYPDIGKGMLVCSDDKRPDIMTASWGGFGTVWGRPVCFCFIRPQRFTYGQIENSERFSLSFMPVQYFDALAYCGTHSGADTDKFADCALTCAYDGNTPYVAEAQTVIICRKLYCCDFSADGFTCDATLRDEILSRFYSAGDFHRMYIGEAEKLLQKKLDVQ